MPRIGIVVTMFFSLGGLAACEAVGEQPALEIGMANPASDYCIKVGGSLEVRQSISGEVGYCTLPDGRSVEEWELFRAEGIHTQSDL